MPRRKKSSRRRSPRSIRLLNVLESYTYATILSEGLAGTSPWGLITGSTDLGVESQYVGTSWLGGAQYSDVTVGADAISLGDMISQPQLALAAVQGNFASNWKSMAIQSALTRFTFKFGKKLLSQPINNVNRNLMKPMFGASIKI